MSFRDFYYVGKKLNVLKELESFGKSLAYKSDPNNYEEKDRKKALHYVPEVEATRKVYARIKSGEDALRLLKELNLFVKEKDLELLIEKIRKQGD
jgi:hypothetical protein